jgi:hypothetical protein
MDKPQSLIDAWEDQAKWSAAAAYFKEHLSRVRTGIFCLSITGAAAETLAAQLHSNNVTSARTIAAVGAISIALAAALQSQARIPERIERWTRARAASEALKEHVFRYLARTGTYAAANPEGELRRKREEITNNVSDLLPRVQGAPAAAKREAPQFSDLAGYVNARVEPQIEGFYLKRSDEFRAKAATWRRVNAALLFVSAVLGAIVSALPYLLRLGGWIAVLTTITGAIAAHVETLRLDQLVISYEKTGQRLKGLRAEFRDSLSKRTAPLTQAEMDDFVNRCETAISSENQSWMALWNKKDPTP